MHRDTKLGLALAILVMGFAAALCFPRMPEEKTVDLASLSAREIDPLIERGQVKVYTDADRPKSRGATEAVSEQVREVTPDREVLPLTVDSDPTYSPREPEPTPIEPADFPAEVIAPPEQVVHTRTYVVQPNDTLSGIARKTLLDGNRYQELRAANPDLVLQDPKDLKPGMVLQIPIPDGGEVPPAAENLNPIVNTQPASLVVPSRPEPVSPRPSGRFGSPRSRVGSTTATPKLN